MDTLMATLTLLIGVAVRLAAPLIITAGVVAWLRRWDARWQVEAEQARQQMASAPATPCWEAKACPPEQRATCPAYQKPSVPCWQMKRYTTGRLPEACLECAVFRNAPVLKPAPLAARTGRSAIPGGKSI